MAEMNVPGVEYRDVVGFPGYKVGSDGTVWTCKVTNRGMTDVWKPLRPKAGRRGHLRATLSLGGKRRLVFVHHLVLLAFHGPRPSGANGLHGPDRNPSNNNANNLRWGTQKDNCLDREMDGNTCHGERHPKAKLTERDVLEIREMAAAGVPDDEIAKRFNIKNGTVHAARTGFTWKHVAGLRTQSHRRELRKATVTK